jgi:hypothetical protein
VRRAAATLAISALLLTALAAPASGRVLAKAYGGKSAYEARATVRVGNPHRLRFEVASRRQERMVVHTELRCVYGRHGRWHRTGKRFSAKPPIEGRVPVPGDPRACVFSVTADRHDFAGWMAVTLYGRGLILARPGGGSDPR